MALAYRIDVLWGDVMITNSDMTLYHYDKKQKVYQRIQIHGVNWSHQSIANFDKRGQANCDTVKILIPATNVTNLEVTIGKDLVVKGICNASISNSSEETQARSIKSLIADYDVHTVTLYDPRLDYRPAMQHYELSCK